WLVVGVIRKARVLIVGPSNEILDAYFNNEATEKVAKVDRIAPAQLGTDQYRVPAHNGAYDLVIFDRCAPENEEDMPRGNTLFIGCPPPPWKLSEQKKLTGPPVKGWISKHAALQNLTALHEIGISEAFEMKNLPPRTPPLIESQLNTVLFLSLSRHSFTDFVLTFPLISDNGKWNTDWPLKPSFPLFLRNVLYAYGNVSDAA